MTYTKRDRKEKRAIDDWRSPREDNNEENGMKAFGMKVFRHLQGCFVFCIFRRKLPCTLFCPAE